MVQLSSLLEKGISEAGGTIYKIKSATTNILQDIGGTIRANPVTTSVAAGTVTTVGAAGLVTALVSSSKTKKKRTSTKKKSKKSRYRYNKKGKRIRTTPYTVGKGKDRSTKRIRYTKKGQPYIIMASGKARFIKKSSAKQSHKRKGGRY